MKGTARGVLALGAPAVLAAVAPLRAVAESVGRGGSRLAEAVDSVLPRIRGLAQLLREQIRQRLAAMGSFMKSLAGIPGAKVLLYVGEGIHAHPAESFFRMWEERYPSLAREEGMSTGLEANRFGVRDELRDLVARQRRVGEHLHPRCRGCG